MSDPKPGLAPPEKVPVWVICIAGAQRLTMQSGKSYTRDTPTTPGIHVQSGTGWRAPTDEELRALARGEVVYG